MHLMTLTFLSNQIRQRGCRLFPAAEEHRKTRECKRRAECDDPHVAVGPCVSSECGAWAPAETKGRAMRHSVQPLQESWRRAECAPERTQDERGPPKAMAVA